MSLANLSPSLSVPPLSLSGAHFVSVVMLFGCAVVAVYVVLRSRMPDGDVRDKTKILV